MYLIRKLFVASAFIVLAGCEDEQDNIVSSTDIPTGAMYATIELQDFGMGTVATNVQLTLNGLPVDGKSGDEYVELDNHDSLWLSQEDSVRDIDLSDNLFASLFSASQQLKELSSNYNERDEHLLFIATWSTPHQVNYLGSIKAEAAQEQFNISLIRDNYADALESTITLPSDFTLEVSESMTSRSTQSLAINWHPIEPDAVVNLSVNITCPTGQIQEHTFEAIADSGMMTLEAGSLYNEELVGECATTVKLTKTVVGELDPNFAGGIITGSQIRSITTLTTD